jgi:hypothetical protein
MELAIDKASNGECAFVAVRNSNHYGTAAYYAEMAARSGMIGFRSFFRKGRGRLIRENRRRAELRPCARAA